MTQNLEYDAIIVGAGGAGLYAALEAGRRAKTAVLSNKPHEHVEPMVQALFGRWPWAAIEGCRHPSQRKPDPRSLWPILSTMRLQPPEVVMVGDSALDVLTGRNVGTATVGVTWGFRDRSTLIDAGVEYLIDRPEQLLQLL